MDQKIKLRRILYTVGLISGGGVLLLQLVKAIKSISLIEFSKDFLSAVVLAVFFAFIAIGLQIIGWLYLINAGESKINLISAIKGYSISFLPRYLPGTVLGYLSRSEWLLNNFSIPYSISNSISLWELLASLTANVFIIIVFIFIKSHLKILFFVMFVITFPCVIWAFCNYLIRLIQKKKIILIHKPIVIKTISAGRWHLSFLFFLFHWSLLGLSLNQILFGIKISSISLFEVIFSSNLSWISGFLVIFAPAGLGFREASLANILGSLFNLRAGNGEITAVLFRLVTIISEVIWIVLGLAFRNYKKNKN